MHKQTRKIWLVSPLIPNKLKDELIEFHGHPEAWYMGHLVSYIMRPNKVLKGYLETKRKSLNLTKPFIGYI